MTTQTRRGSRGRRARHPLGSKDVSVSLSGRQILHDVTFRVRGRRVHRADRLERSGQDDVVAGDPGPDRPRRTGDDPGGRTGPVPAEPADRLRPPEDRPRSRHAPAGPGPGRPGPRRAPLRAAPAARPGGTRWSTRCSTPSTPPRFADARVGNLSGGEQQRVMIAHALISRPRLLLLDEPLANLDIRSEQEVVELVARIAAEQQIAVLISAHDMNPLLPVMDRVVYLAGGRVASGHHRRGGHHRGRSAGSTATTSTSSTSNGRVLVVAGREHEALHHRRRAGPARDDVVLAHATWSPMFEPGFFSSSPVQVALVVGGGRRPSCPAWSACSPSSAASPSPATRCPTSGRPAARPPSWSGSARSTASWP